MATVLFSALGASFGSAIGGSFLGLSMTAVGRFAGAVIGRGIDNRILGGGSDPVEVGRLDRMRFSGSGEGYPIAHVFGRSRVAGHVIWATHFKEAVEKSGGTSAGKGAPPSPEIHTYKYSVSLALGLCAGEISHVARVWADGQETALRDLNFTVYHGTEDQLPDPLMEAVEGAGAVPAYRGLAYVVIEDLDLSKFGNRVPQFTFEVCRPAQNLPDLPAEPADLIQGVCIIPGSGEYALAQTKLHYDKGNDQYQNANAHSASGYSDAQTSFTNLAAEIPNCETASLVVSWFGDDLRCGECQIAPKVEQRAAESPDMPWTSGGISRAEADQVPQKEDRPIYGGTPSDTSVVQAIQMLSERGQDVVFYPFILMSQMAGNGLPDPYQAQDEQAELPWRGRITTSLAPNLAGTPDKTDTARAEVDAFFGTAQPSDYFIQDQGVIYSGPNEWSYRRFILHYAHLCKLAGHVHAFCIGSELRGLTQIRSSETEFPAVDHLCQLAQDVRAILGPDVKIGYAADWSEYFGYHPHDGSGDALYHLDPLWANSAIDFVGIDNYMPLSDWRDSDAHLDQSYGSIYNLDYLKQNIEGGEGYDWYYASDHDRARQIRTPITDDQYGEPWIWRYKDIKNWWRAAHYNRLNGVRQSAPTAWMPQSKPIWFTELGCAAVDKATNQPNKFLDPKSSESSLPHYSTGHRDDYIQMQYLRAHYDYWNDPRRNPISFEYGEPMIDMRKSCVWAWDARPFPVFPKASDVWSDGANYDRGHWLNGRVSYTSLANVVAELCALAGIVQFDVSRLHGVVKGYTLKDSFSARAALQSLALAYGFDASEDQGKLVFRHRRDAKTCDIDPKDVVVITAQNAPIEIKRSSVQESTGRLQLGFETAEGDYDIAQEEIVFPDGTSESVSKNEFPLALTRYEARAMLQRWLAEIRTGQTHIKFALPYRYAHLRVGDQVRIDVTPSIVCRVDQIERGPFITVEGTAVVASAYEKPTYQNLDRDGYSVFAPLPASLAIMDLPLMRGGENPVSPTFAAASQAWDGGIAVVEIEEDDANLIHIIRNQSTVGHLAESLDRGRSSLMMREGSCVVTLLSGSLSSVTQVQLLNGANTIALGGDDPATWEVAQFQYATLIGPRTYRIHGFVRGKYGTDVQIPDVWPVGTKCVLLDGTAEQPDMALEDVNRPKTIKFGPVSAPITEPVYKSREVEFSARGLKPLKPCFLRLQEQDGETYVTWVRRGRLSADAWGEGDIPLGEAYERYRVRFFDDDNQVLETYADEPRLHLSPAFVTPNATRVTVQQVSDLYGAGDAAELYL